jgi:hypothetical protein
MVSGSGEARSHPVRGGATNKVGGITRYCTITVPCMRGWIEQKYL